MAIWISIHAPRTGSDALVASSGQFCNLFQSTLPARGATGQAPHDNRAEADFNPRSPHGERLCANFCYKRRTQFQSTLPARGATISGLNGRMVDVISIHAPRTGSDGFFRRWHGQGQHISIHAPRTGSDSANSTE